MLRWSPKPKESYVKDGAGPGRHQAFDLFPGAWNIYWLSSELLDAYIGVGSEIGWTEFLIGASVGSALQRYEGVGETIGDLALRVAPAEFIQTLRDCKLQKYGGILIARAMGPSWWETIERRAGLYVPEPVKIEGTNVIRVSFGTARG